MSLKEIFDKLHQTYREDETLCLSPLIEQARLPKPKVKIIQERAKDWMQSIRSNRLKQSGLDAFLYQYDLSSSEGIALMCLAEALLRVPDSETIDRLIKDKIVSQDWEEHLGKSPSWFVNAATLGLMLTGKVLSGEEQDPKTLLGSFKRVMTRSGEPVIREAVRAAMKILGKQFVMGRNISEALKRAQKTEKQGYRYSYDMLGEAAKTMEDAEYYFDAYKNAIAAISEVNQGLGPIRGPGISVKLSALHPRYEWAKREQMVKELLPKLMELCEAAKASNMGLTIDAEEADRLELSLILIEKILENKQFRTWQGFGLAIQAYQKRAWHVIDWVQTLAEKLQQPMMVRLVKGAYWDSEIKWAQEKGLSGYPVFTRKTATDVSYLACAHKLLTGTELIFPQFATHNAYSASYVLEVAEQQNRKDKFEFQCLHGMGDALYSNIVGKDKLNLPCRIYAPVGSHEHLLGYLVRRLLENGANTSFVNRIIDENTPIETLIQDPVEQLNNLKEKPHPKIPLPKAIYGTTRPNSRGIDLTNPQEVDPVMLDITQHIDQDPHCFSEKLEPTDLASIPQLFNKAKVAAKAWTLKSPEERAVVLANLAEILEKNRATLLSLLIREGGKTVMDSISELREAIDYCWYYRQRVLEDFQVLRLPGPTGERNQLALQGRGVFACISPWNFPLAIFLGQVLGALTAGNAVLAKPASQTPRLGELAIQFCHKAGFPKDLVQCLIGSGAKISGALLNDPNLAGVMFTGSTDTARNINKTLAERNGPILPFVAETGGQNAMIVDSSALPEQVVTDVLTSAFNSAGQRCSALRVLFVQKDIADRVIKMLKGAMDELKMGEPFDLSVDVGPVIDKNAADELQKHVDKMNVQGKLICRLDLAKYQLPELSKGYFFAPHMYEIESLDLLKQEVFGPVLHIIRYSADALDKVMDAIHNTGFGLTLGIHSRIADTVEYIASRMHVGNIYVNRNMIGAVVGVQPFGGEGLSGTGPKAGGPHILPRLALERTLSVNIAATGGNVDLLSLSE